MNIISALITVVLTAVLVSFLLSYPLMLLWNGCLVPAVTVLTKVTWLQAWGIMVVCAMLFKSTHTSK